MSLNCKNLTIPLYIAMVATVINPYVCNCMIENFIMLLWLTMWLPFVESYITTFVVIFTLRSLYAHELFLHCCVRLFTMNVVNTIVCT
jgi:hypothetical protein